METYDILSKHRVNENNVTKLSFALDFLSRFLHRNNFVDQKEWEESSYLYSKDEVKNLNLKVFRLLEGDYSIDEKFLRSHARLGFTYAAFFTYPLDYNYMQGLMASALLDEDLITLKQLHLNKFINEESISEALYFLKKNGIQQITVNEMELIEKLDRMITPSDVIVRDDALVIFWWPLPVDFKEFINSSFYQKLPPELRLKIAGRWLIDWELVSFSFFENMNFLREHSLFYPPTEMFIGNRETIPKEDIIFWTKNRSRLSLSFQLLNIMFVPPELGEFVTTAMFLFDTNQIPGGVDFFHTFTDVILFDLENVNSTIITDYIDPQIFLQMLFLSFSYNNGHLNFKHLSMLIKSPYAQKAVNTVRDVGQTYLEKLIEDYYIQTGNYTI